VKNTARLENAILRIAATNGIEAWIGYQIIEQDNGTLAFAISVYVHDDVSIDHIRSVVLSSVSVQMA
jgi:hypothetical protein